MQDRTTAHCLPFDVRNVFEVAVEDLEGELRLETDGHCIKQEVLREREEREGEREITENPHEKILSFSVTAEPLIQACAALLGHHFLTLRLKKHQRCWFLTACHWCWTWPWANLSAVHTSQQAGSHEPTSLFGYHLAQLWFVYVMLSVKNTQSFGVPNSGRVYAYSGSVAQWIDLILTVITNQQVNENLLAFDCPFTVNI